MSDQAEANLETAAAHRPVQESTAGDFTARVATSPSLSFPVVGVGASAGGLEALERFFAHAPERSGMAYVVIQHLSPDFRSLTDELLARRTRIPIRQAVDGMLVEPDVIYLLPPKKDMILSGGHLLLTDKDPGQALALPIDRFFRSMAQDIGELSVGVILSGTGSDGSRGIRDIHAARGLVIAQEPETAKFDGMPKTAVGTGAVDHIVPPEDAPLAIARHFDSSSEGSAKDRPENPTAVGIESVFRRLRDAYGIDFSNYKPETVARRTERRLAMLRLGNVDEYAARLATDSVELNLLYKDLLIGVTRFFRDPDAFDRLAREELPRLLDRLGRGDEFRLWVAACATGEEAYSLGILLLEAMDRLSTPAPVRIFATDVHRASLDTASAGVYSAESLAGLAPERLERFFTRRGDFYQVSPELRKMVVFARHNLLQDAPFTKVDLITCRNLLIYFLPPAQKKALSLFHFGLKAGGALFLGPSEGPGALADEFDVVDTRWKIYRKRRDVRLATDIRLAPPPPAVVSAPAPLNSISPSPIHLASVASLLEMVTEAVASPSLLVNDRRELLRSFAGASKYLVLQDGWHSPDVLEMVRPELRAVLAGALPHVFRDGLPVTMRGLEFKSGGENLTVDLAIRPLRDPRGSGSYALIEIHDVESTVSRDPTSHDLNLDEAAREHLETVERDLQFTRESLQATIEELETSNEELQATNEELTASNEELQSTNEELHSVNEELYTVNGEFQKKIEELTELTADMTNLLGATEVHTVFLDKNLKIRKFTPHIAEVFNLMLQDIGRPIEHLTHGIDHAEMLEDLRRVIEQGDPIERQVRDRRDRWFLMRLMPYRNGQAVDGVVLTLVDIGRVKQAEDEAREKDRQLASILKNSPNLVFVKDTAGRYMLVDEAFRKLTGIDPIGRTAADVFPPDVAAAMRSQDERVLNEGRSIEVELIIPHADGPHTYLSIMFPIRDESGTITGLGGIRTDVTQMKRAEAQARQAVAQRDQFLAMLSHELRNPLAAIRNTASLLERRVINAEGVAEMIGVISRRSLHMARLLDDLLDVARITQNKMEMRFEALDLTTIVDDVVEETRQVFTERDVRLHIAIEDRPLFVQGDSARLQQAQVNLLVNAAKYTPPGGDVWLSLRSLGDAVEIRVRDSGVGMTREMIDKAFELFTQGSEQLDRAHGGIGVGLTLVRTIVGLHGGTVLAESEGLGKGSVFVVRIPRTEDPGEVLHSTDPVGSASHSNRPSVWPRTFLLVEDDPDTRHSMAALLRLDGFEVRAVANGPAAMEELTREIPDVALVDIGIPGMDGYELSRRIREAYSDSSLVLIALTGYGRDSDREKTRAAGFHAHLTKPFEPVELTRALQAMRPRGFQRRLDRPLAS